jgi:pyridoxamine 5'-phosphate oxidase
MTDPIAQFHEWFEAARAAGVPFPETMTLATASADGAPSARMVLLKSADEDGFVFFTGYESRKGRELAVNPRAALVLYWQAVGRQVRVEGLVERVPEAESADYWATRPRGSQLAAWASRQSRPLSGRDELEARYGELESEHERRDVPLPPHWGGFRVRPEAIEFWEHRDNRLHDRVRHTRGGGGWTVERLWP